MARRKLSMLQPRIKTLPDRIPTLSTKGVPYYWETRVGVFVITNKGGRWHAMFKGDSLGSYGTPQHAADDLAGGHTFSPGSGIDTAKLGISHDLNDWTRGNPPKDY